MPCALLLSRQNAFAQLLKKTRRQHAGLILVRAAWDRSQVKSRPCEAVQLVETEPMAAAVQSETPTGRGRNFDGSRGIFGRLMRDGGRQLCRCRHLALVG